MEIYKSEIEDGLRDSILANTSLSFASRIEFNPNPVISETIQKAFASELKIKEGLYHTKSILVSTVWNLNDDVFDKIETWKARATPEDKPTNLGHDEKQIVGHITGNWPVDSKGELIDSDIAIDDLPDTFHIINSAVIYTVWQDKDLVERTKALIKDIEEDRKYVSMECVFSGFDYAIIGPDGTPHMITRSADTAFLTKHLRAYGGEGKYQDHKVGRLLRNITFSGKGYVDKPANPNSIILKGEDFNFSAAKQNDVILKDDGVLIFSVGTNLQENDSKMTAEIEKQVAELAKKLAESESALAKANIDLKNTNDKVNELTNSLNTKATELATANESIKQLNDKMTAEVAKSTELTKALEDTNKAKAAVDGELATIKAKELETRRVSQLVSGGVAKDVAEAKVKAFVAFTDDQFNIVAEALITAAKAHVEAPKPEEDIDSDKAGEAAAKAAAEAAAQAAAEAAKAGTIVKPTSEDEQKIEATRASISDYISKKLGVVDETK